MSASPAGMRLGVLASGRGSNLRNLLELGFEIVAVATNRPSCGAVQIARDHGVPLGEFSQKAFGSVEERDLAMRRFLEEHGVEIVVNAGYDRILTPGFTAGWPGRILNVHPSLLPAFAGGMDAVRQALAAGVSETGATVHVVTDEVDAGPILLQEAVPVLPGDDEETLLGRVHEAEYRILPAAIRLLEERLHAESASLRK